jgi:hypothetical protein
MLGCYHFAPPGGTELAGGTRIESPLGHAVLAGRRTGAPEWSNARR